VDYGLGVLFAILQITLMLVFLIWLWIVRAGSAKRGPADAREKLLWLAGIFFTLAVTAEFYHMFASPTKFPVLASFTLACLGVVLALFGKGKGRIVTAIGCCGLALSWLPFILPWCKRLFTASLS
jgi:hypothetical protein